MKVELVSVTKPAGKLAELLNNAEDLIVYCARVSNPENQTNMSTGPKLISYLYIHEHWSPFEMADMTVEIQTSRAIAAQLLRHRSFSFQEFSQRYTTNTSFEFPELRKQAEVNRQSSSEIINDGLAREAVYTILQHATNIYYELMDKGVARECARMILPLCTSTTLYMKGSLRSWIHYIQLRTKDDTQKEHRDIAEECKKIFTQNFPTIAKAIIW